MEKILIVDDESEIADLVEVYLSNEQYEVVKFYNAVEARNYLDENSVDLAILDVMMPEIDGLTLCRHIRKKHYFPIIMLTAKVSDTDKIAGLTMGADDYVTKPFNPLELMARVKTQLRRFKRYNQEATGNDMDEYFIKGLSISKKNHKCLLNNSVLNLTPIEFKILLYLCEHQGEVVTSEELFEAVWEEKYFDSNNTVMAHIARLREKMNEPARKPQYIKTVWGVGYTIEK